jgi:YjbE family integral membrane protein
MVNRQYEAGDSLRFTGQMYHASGTVPSKTFDATSAATAGCFEGSPPPRMPPTCAGQTHPTSTHPAADLIHRSLSWELDVPFFSPEWFSALLAIVLIDLVLAGDNAIVIALAARSLPTHLQRKAIIWGTVGAIAIRSLMTLAVVWLLKIPGLMLVGGLGLVWIAIKLLTPQDTDEHGNLAVNTFWGAMKTIVVADALMGVDNVLGVAGAAHGSFDLVIIGLLISVPIVVWGSTLVLGLVERFPAISYLGAGVLAFTAAKMIVSEPLLGGLFGEQVLWRWLTYGVVVLGVLSLGHYLSKRPARAAAAHSAT